MDTSGQYIEMCEGADKLQQEKYGIGYFSGDYILGEDNIPILIGFDILGVERFIYDGLPSIRLRVLEPTPVFNFDIEANYSATIKVAELTVKVLHTHGIPTCLFRQDQLQEMVGERVWSNLFKFLDFHCHCVGGTEFYGWPIENSDKFSSMEQLWLAFVMHEKFGKIWNGEEWMEDTDG